MTQSRTCPFCNALLAGPVDLCPVCGERLTRASVPAPFTQQTGSPKRTALVVGSGMALLASITLAFSLWTQAGRRDNDHGEPPRPPRSPFDTPATGPVLPMAPDQYAALRYLPGEIDLLVGLHFARLYDDPTTRELLSQSLSVGPARIRLGDVPTWVGLAPEVVDHAILGLTLPKAGLPTIVLVVRTRRDIDVDAVKKALKARPVVNAPANEKRILLDVELAKLELKPVLWLADTRTLVLGLTQAQLDGLPLASADRLGHLRDDLRGLLKERLDPGVGVWSAGVLRDGLRGIAGGATAGLLERWKIPPGPRLALAGLQRFTAGVVSGEEIVARLNLELENQAGAAQVTDYLSSPELRHLRIAGDGAWVLLQWKTTREQLAEALQR